MPLFYVNCGLPHLRITKICLSGPFSFSSQFTYRSDNGLTFQNEITDLYFNLAFACSCRRGGKLDQHPACGNGDYVCYFAVAHCHQLIDHIDRHADMVGDDPYDIANCGLMGAF